MQGENGSRQWTPTGHEGQHDQEGHPGGFGFYATSSSDLGAGFRHHHAYVANHQLRLRIQSFGNDSSLVEDANCLLIYSEVLLKGFINLLLILDFILELYLYILTLYIYKIY